jgi:hypothetical protein
MKYPRYLAFSLAVLRSVTTGHAMTVGRQLLSQNYDMEAHEARNEISRSLLGGYCSLAPHQLYAPTVGCQAGQVCVADVHVGCEEHRAREGSSTGSCAWP